MKINNYKYLLQSTLLFLSIFFISNTTNAQINIIGDWQMGPLRKVSFMDDLTFNLQKGIHNYKGEFKIIETDSNVILRMKFVKQTIEYSLILIHPHKIKLINREDQRIILAEKIRSVNNNSNEGKVIIENHTILTQPLTFNGLEQDENNFKEEIHENKFLFSLNIGGKLNVARAQLSVLDTTFVQDNIKSSISSSPAFHYSAGLKLGYRIKDYIYVGGGINYTFYNYNVKQDIILSDPIYQYDSESNQSASYNLNLIEIPIWINALTLSNYRVEAGAYLAIPLRNSSLAHFSNSTQVRINGEIDIENSKEPQDYTIKFPDLPNPISYGGYFEFQKHITKTFGVSLGYRYTSNYSYFDSQPISNHSLSLNLIIQLF